jgi:hypothetical protein
LPVGYDVNKINGGYSSALLDGLWVQRAKIPHYKLRFIQLEIHFSLRFFVELHY